MTATSRVISAFYAAYDAHDWAGATALYAPGASHYEAAMDKTRTGREAIAEGLAGLARMLPDVRWHEGERIVSGRHVLVRYDMTGTFTPRAAEGAAPAPRAVALPGCHLFTFEDGAIVATADYWDKDAFLGQIR